MFSCRLRRTAISLGCSRGELSVLQDRRWKVGACVGWASDAQMGRGGEAEVVCVGIIVGWEGG